MASYQTGVQTFEASSCTDPHTANSALESLLEVLDYPIIVDPENPVDPDSPIYKPVVYNVNEGTVVVQGDTNTTIIGSTINIMQARIGSAVLTGHQDFTVTPETLVSGTLPESNVSVKNIFAEDYYPAELILVVQRDDLEWIPLQQKDTNTVGGGGGSYTAGDGIAISDDIIATRVGDGLTHDSGDQAIDLDANSALEINGEKLRASYRYHEAQGAVAVTMASASVGPVTLNTTGGNWGEAPPDPITATGVNKFQCDAGETLYVKALGNAASPASHWSTDNMENLVPIMRGVSGYDGASSEQYLGHQIGGVLKWKDPSEIEVVVDFSATFEIVGTTLEIEYTLTKQDIKAFSGSGFQNESETISVPIEDCPTS